MVEDTKVDVGHHPTLVMSGISKSYAGVAALTDVSLDVVAGEIHALLGENGAGKSTLMGVASGATQADAGTITFAGESIASLDPAVATELGIAIVHQHPAVLPDMTVEENIRVAIPPSVLRAGGDERATMRSMLVGVGATVHLADRVEELSVAQKHLLEIAKALVISPRLLILDEPTAPLGQRQRRTAVPPGPRGRGPAAAPSSTSPTDSPRSGSWPIASPSCATASCAAPRRSIRSPTTNCSRSSSADSWTRRSRPSTRLSPTSATILNVESISGDGFSERHPDRDGGRDRRCRRCCGQRPEPTAPRAGRPRLATPATSPFAAPSTGRSSLLDMSAYLPADRHGEGADDVAVGAGERRGRRTATSSRVARC